MKKIMVVWLSIVCMIALVGCLDNSSPNPETSKPPANVSDPSISAEESDIPGEITQQETPSVEDTQYAEDAPSTKDTSSEDTPSAENTQKGNDAIPAINIQVGSKNFTAILQDNDSARTLLEKLPLTIDMGELNGNEKFYFFPERFPSDSQRVGNIKAGDLMLYGSDCLVLFYESFSTSYSYTRLGYIEDPAGLAEALGSGSVQVTFSIDN